MRGKRGRGEEVLGGGYGGEEEKRGEKNRWRLGFLKKLNLRHCKGAPRLCVVHKAHVHYMQGTKALRVRLFTRHLITTCGKGEKEKVGGKKEEGKEGKMGGMTSNTRLRLKGTLRVHATRLYRDTQPYAT